MLNNVVDGIVAAINGGFGDTIPIHTEVTEQDFDDPCFFVRLSNSTFKQMIGNRYLWKNLCLVLYFPTPGGDRQAECNSVLESLLMLLEVIEFDGTKVRATDIVCQMEEGVLAMSINYDFFVYKAIQETNMGELEVKELVNDEEQ